MLDPSTDLASAAYEAAMRAHGFDDERPTPAELAEDSAMDRVRSRYPGSRTRTDGGWTLRTDI